MRILVTGGCGFIGSHFVRALLRDHSNFVVNVDCLYPCSTKDLQQNNENYVFVKGDITQPNLILSRLLLHEIEYVVHFAAQSHVDTSFTNAGIYTRDNVYGTQVILEALRVCHATSRSVKPRMIHISTDEVYGEAHEDAKTENSLLQPTNPYAASKAAAEMYVSAYRKSYNLPIVTIRGNNAYGPCQYQEKVIPRFIALLQEQKALTIHGSGQQQRSFIYVEDFVQAVLCVLKNGVDGKVYNIGSKDEISILQLSEMLSKLMHVERQNVAVVHVQDRTFNDSRYLLDSSALQSLGWRQVVGLEEGLKRTIAWYTTSESKQYFMQEFAPPSLQPLLLNT